MERYRSGHNGTVLKTVDPQGSVGSNPTLSARKDPTFVYDKCGVFSTKSVLSDGINPTFVGWNHFVMKSDFVGRRTDLISSALADFIRATLGFHRVLHDFIENLYMMWYNNFKPTAVERRRNAEGIWKLAFSFKNIESLNPSHCGATNGFAVSMAIAFGFMI